MRSEYEAMIRSVGIKPGWHVLDAGCGGGSFLMLLAELVGSSGHISALDQAPEHIEVVEMLVDSGRFVCPVAANRQIQGTLRVLHLPIWIKKAGLIDVRYKTTICERQAPLRPN
jgi:tRNA A58 N-methylase Trm61